MPYVNIKVTNECVIKK